MVNKSFMYKQFIKKKTHTLTKTLPELAYSCATFYHCNFSLIRV